MYTRTGYLFLLEKKALGTTSWQKCYCQYIRENRYSEQGRGVRANSPVMEI